MYTYDDIYDNDNNDNEDDDVGYDVVRDYQIPLPDDNDNDDDYDDYDEQSLELHDNLAMIKR